jgi:hypothetical protein
MPVTNVLSQPVSANVSTAIPAKKGTQWPIIGKIKSYRCRAAKNRMIRWTVGMDYWHSAGKPKHRR